MDERAKLRAAYAALRKSRNEYDAWIKRVLAGKKPTLKAKGFRLARDVQKKTEAFMTASKPFIYPKTR